MTADAETARLLREPDPDWEVDSSLTGRRYTFQDPAPNPSTDGLAFDLDFGLTRYFAPLRDDGAPYSLQPFLQRSSIWSLSLDGGRISTRNPFGGQDRTEWDSGISTSIDAYVRRWLALNGGVGYGNASLRDVGISQTTHSFNAFAEVGLRVADTRIDAWYALTALERSGSFAPLRQRVGASAFTAIARRFSLNASASVIPSGVTASLGLEAFPARELGIFGGTSAARGKLYNVDLVATRYAGWIGVAGWIDPTMGILGQYNLFVEDDPQASGQSAREVSHAITLEVFARFGQL
jgi:hypothetical protein